MAEYGEKFKGLRKQVFCPFGCPELDTQEHSYTSCDSIRSKVNVNRRYDNIFQSNISFHTGFTINEILKARKSLLEEKFIDYSPFNNTINTSLLNSGPCAS